MPLTTTMFDNIFSKFTEEEKQQFKEGWWLYNYRRFFTNTATIKPQCSNKIPKHMRYPAIIGYMFYYKYYPEERTIPCK